MFSVGFLGSNISHLPCLILHFNLFFSLRLNNTSVHFFFSQKITIDTKIKSDMIMFFRVSTVNPGIIRLTMFSYIPQWVKQYMRLAVCILVP